MALVEDLVEVRVSLERPSPSVRRLLDIAGLTDALPVIAEKAGAQR